MKKIEDPNLLIPEKLYADCKTLEAQTILQFSHKDDEGNLFFKYASGMKCYIANDEGFITGFKLGTGEYEGPFYEYEPPKVEQFKPHNDESAGWLPDE